MNQKAGSAFCTGHASYTAFTTASDVVFLFLPSLFVPSARCSGVQPLAFFSLAASGQACKSASCKSAGHAVNGRNATCNGVLPSLSFSLAAPGLECAAPINTERVGVSAYLEMIGD